MISNTSDHGSTYATRSDDVRYPSLPDLIAAAEHDKFQSVEKVYNLRDLQAVPSDDGRGVVIASPVGSAKLTQFAFEQVCRLGNTPPQYVRELPADLAAQCVNHGLHDRAPVGHRTKLLVRAANGDPTPTIRAANGTRYGRLFDADFYSDLSRFAERDGWTLTGQTGTTTASVVDVGDAVRKSLRPQCTRGDRDSYVTLVNTDHPIVDPTSPESPLFRAFRAWNSEVGGKSVGFAAGLMRPACSNLQIWAFDIAATARRRHVGDNVRQDIVSKIASFARSWSERPAEHDEQVVAWLVEHEIAKTKAGVVDMLVSYGIGRKDAIAAFERCEVTERIASPASYWGIAQGFTRLSQDEQNSDARHVYDAIAADVIKRGARKLQAA